MRIKCLTKFKDTADGVPVTFEADDICTVSDEDGARFVSAGWAEDLGGAVATGEPATGGTDLDIANVKSGHSSNTVGG